MKTNIPNEMNQQRDSVFGRCSGICRLMKINPLIPNSMLVLVKASYTFKGSSSPMRGEGLVRQAQILGLAEVLKTSNIVGARM